MQTGILTTLGNNIGVTSKDGIVLQNSTSASIGAQQFSPRLRLTGQGFETNTAASQQTDWIMENQPVQGVTNPTSNLVFSNQINNSGFSSVLTITATGINLGTALSIANGGTGQTSAANAINALLPNQAGQSGNFLTSNGSVTSWAASALSIANGGTGQTSAANAINALLPSQAAQSGNFLTTNGSVASWATVAGGSGTGANPTGTIGLSTVNGVALTFLRSDSAPPLSQAIAPTWTGVHTWTNVAPIVVTQGVATSGSPSAMIITGGAHTTLTTATEAVDINFNMARTVQFATGSITSQRCFFVQAPTWGFVGASTITNAHTMSLNAFVAGTNCTVTNASTLNIQGAPTTSGGGAITNKYALTVGGAAAPIFSVNATGQTTALTLGLSSEFDNGNSSTSITVNWANGSRQKLTLTGNCVITFSNGIIGSMQLKLIQNSSGGPYSITFASTTVKTSSGVVPVLSTAASAIDIIGVYYDGTTYYAATAVLNAQFAA